MKDSSKSKRVLPNIGLPAPDEFDLPARIDYTTERKKGPYVDGDTFVVALYVPKVKLWISDRWIRLLGVNTKETDGPDREDGLVAKEFTMGWLINQHAASALPLTVRMWKPDHFGRMMAWVYSNTTGESLSEVLIAHGYSVEVEKYQMERPNYWRASGRFEVTPLES